MINDDVGLFPDIPNADYHGGRGISKSGLDLIARSPLHYKFARDSANDNGPTAAQRIGSAAHAMILEPQTFADLYAVAPDVDRRTKAGKETWAEFVAENDGKDLLTETEMDQLERMRDAVMAHPAAAGLLTSVPGMAEVSAYWRDPDTGLVCRCRPDFWRADGILVDLKTTDDASPEAFGKSIWNWRYHVQHPFYLDGCRLAIEQGDPVTFRSGDVDLTLPPPTHFLFIVVEKKAPHAVAVYKLDADSVALGERQYRQDLATYAECTASGIWPAFGDSIQQISVPDWVLRKEAFSE